MMIATWRGKMIQGLPPLSRKHALAAAAPAAISVNGREARAEPSPARDDRRRESAHDRGRLRKPPSPPEPSIIRSTLRALLHPRRLIADPAGLGVAGRRAGQLQRATRWRSRWAIAMCLVFVMVAPVSWRVLFPDRFDLRHGGIRLILYGAIGGGRGAGARHRGAAHARHGTHAADGAHQRGGLPGAVPGRRLGPRARHLAREQPARAPRRAPTLLAREAERAQLLALRSHLDPALPVQHAERHRRVVPRGRRDRRARGAAAVGDAAHGAGGRARRRPGRSPRSWRWSTRCSSCTACAIPTACASTRALPEPLPEVAVPADAAAAAGRERRQARPGGRPRAATIVLAASHDAPTSRLVIVDSRTRAPTAGRAPGGSGLRHRRAPAGARL